MDQVKISYFTDALCVWAYVSQIRLDELKANFKSGVELDCRYFHVFGNVANKIDTAWKERGGLAGYRRHVHEIVEKFGHVQLNERTWETRVPRSSMPAHLFLCATRHLELCSKCAPGSGDRAAWAVRDGFFRNGRDISQGKVLLEIAEAIGLRAAEIENAIATGVAHAALAEDLELARTQSIAASPTLLFNEGRQRLTGNVGYRIIEANIRELLEAAPGQQSWC
jgi:predicted DsbA family dithiol-disulfide isomerase